MSLCAVCSSELPEYAGKGRPRKVCRDQDSPTPSGGCARWRNIERTTATYNERPGTIRHGHPNPYETWPRGGFIIE